MTALALSVFTASLIGSLHCAGMCGGFVAVAIGDGARGDRAGTLRAHLAFSAGRLVAYTMLGAIAGSVGAALDVAGELAGIGRIAAVVAGALVVALGAAMLLETLGARLPRLDAPGTLRRLLTRGIAAAPSSTGARGFAIGVMAACLPCGWLYTFVLTAATTGSPSRGALIMAVFWLGTVPALVTLAVGLGALAVPLRRHVPAVSAVAMILIGLVAVAGRAGLIAHGPHSQPTRATIHNAPAVEPPHHAGH